MQGIQDTNGIGWSILQNAELLIHCLHVINFTHVCLSEVRSKCNKIGPFQQIEASHKKF